ncbi:hypothetical protein O1611_g3471 [Lasiodiplodia mahajangana]|uniref:Uncharacterized protein n=1 Tax=Lasiodiplodia mahajangana TaxID=1108764 RepID=A0ACC2JRR2_9PEZI|nr:hypothetical protein O1611_g3471 [Lasiodiplodia mahajangana]
MDQTRPNNAQCGNKAQSTDLLGIGSWAGAAPKREDIKDLASGTKRGGSGKTSITEKGKSGTDPMGRWFSESKKDGPWVPDRKS